MRGAVINRETSLYFVGFSIGRVDYAVPVEAVREVVAPGTVTELPHTPSAVIGVTHHRGDVVPIIDLRLRFDLRAEPPASKARWVLVTIEGRPIGLSVDSVSGVFGVSEGELGPPPAVGGGDDERGFKAVTYFAGKLVFVLELARLSDLVRGVEAMVLPPGTPEPS